MHAERIAQLASLAQNHQLNGARPAAPTDGVDLASWRSGTYGPITVQIYLGGTAAANVTAPAGGTAVEVWGFKLNAWWRVATLGGGAQIPIAGPGQGATERVDYLGGFDRLFVAGTASAGTVTAQLVPYEVVR